MSYLSQPSITSTEGTKLTDELFRTFRQFIYTRKVLNSSSVNLVPSVEVMLGCDKITHLYFKLLLLLLTRFKPC